MKFFLLFLIVHSHSILADYSKPKLVSRFSNIDHFNAVSGLFCFTSDPLVTENAVYLSCKSQIGESVLVKYSPDFEVIASSRDNFFSRPVEVNEVISWYEFNEVTLKNVYNYKLSTLEEIKLSNLGPQNSLVDSFYPQKNGAYIFRNQEESKQIFEWKGQKSSPLFSDESAHLFPPVVNSQGDFVFKVRRKHLGEDAPDELIIWTDKFKTILKDHDADSSSQIKSFRHQYSYDQDSIALIMTDQLGEVLVIIKDGQLTQVARVGVDVKSFDYFSPKIKNNVVVFRGNDLQGRKALWVYEKGRLSRLLTQGDTVLTDKGPARADYYSQDALFFSSPGINRNGDIYFQVALTDLESPRTLLGIGLISFQKE